MSRDSMSGIVFTFIVGMGVGAAAALLFAPQAGEDLRDDIVGRVNDGVDQLRSTGKDLKRRGQKFVNMAKDEAGDAIDAATDAYNHAKQG